MGLPSSGGLFKGASCFARMASANAYVLPEINPRSSAQLDLLSPSGVFLIWQLATELSFEDL